MSNRGWWKQTRALRGLLFCVFDVLFFWLSRLIAWWRSKSTRDVLLGALAEANFWEEWEGAAIQLDEDLEYDVWRRNCISKFYDWRLIEERLEALEDARKQGDIQDLISLLRSGLVRNLGNITAPRLFHRAYAGTKSMIEEYIVAVCYAIDYVKRYPTSASSDTGLTDQAKLNVLHDSRLAFGRTVLVLQGGAIFGLCHLGVIKALHLRGLLPRIIAGTATGALIAALVGSHTEMELIEFLSGKNIDLEAFKKHSVAGTENETSGRSGWLATLIRRVKRFINEGYFLDVDVLEEVVRANVGDLTFKEAYQKTNRVLNITVSTTGGGGVPNLLNYLTAPNVLIRSAAVASNAASSPFYRPVTVYCKDETDAIVPWAAAQDTTFRPWTHASYSERESPLHRIAELFNVNHFIVSQARPYLAPFLRSDLHHPNPRQDTWLRQLSIPFVRLIVMEIQHRLRQMDQIGWLPMSIRRFLLDENVPGPSLTVVPELTFADFFKLLENPTEDALDYWILRGERSVWPAIPALKVRCAIEVELDRAYQLVRRRKPFDTLSRRGSLKRITEAQEVRRRERAASLGCEE